MTKVSADLGILHDKAQGKDMQLNPADTKQILSQLRQCRQVASAKTVLGDGATLLQFSLFCLPPVFFVTTIADHTRCLQ